MEKIVQQGILYDFYGELLTEHQKSVYEAVVYENMSLGEIADEQGVSRQAIHDLIKRTDKILLDYENKLGLISRFEKIKDKIRVVDEKLCVIKPSSDDDENEITQIKQLCSQIIDLM